MSITTTSIEEQSLYADPHGQTSDMHPPEILPEATAPECVNHPGEGATPGLGYAGGGYGRYQRCRVCHRVFGKMALKDGNRQSS